MLCFFIIKVIIFIKFVPTTFHIRGYCGHYIQESRNIKKTS
jgi:hypothetical protein